jgi:hypothetical protein
MDTHTPTVILRVTYAGAPLALATALEELWAGTLDPDAVEFSFDELA